MVSLKTLFLNPLLSSTCLPDCFWGNRGGRHSRFLLARLRNFSRRIDEIYYYYKIHQGYKEREREEADGRIRSIFEE